MRRRHRWPAVIGAVALVVLLAGCASAGARVLRPWPHARTAAVHTAPCAAPAAHNPVFSHVEGNHLLDTGRRVIMPYGVTLYGLARTNWQQASADQERLMKGAITEWCTNFIRLQVAPAHLLDRAPYDREYLRAIEAEVAYAASWDQNVILSAQTEWDQGGGGGPNPTSQTARFWKVLAPLFKTDPRVWFDLFNEPRLKAGSEAATWQVWQEGGTVGGVTYVGMQQLVDAVRAAGAPNLVFAEGANWAETLAGLPGHQLTGANIAYAVHSYSAHTPAQWDLRFGNASTTVPVLDDEWSQAAVGKTCSPDATTWVPQFLVYLRQHQIGLGVWGFQPGVLLTSTETFSPTTMPTGYACQRTGAKGQGHNTEGAGQAVEQYFRTYSR
ncbi:MAG: cellulase family glycosylhydrolase [Candidatus Dormibacteraeota bacterium]|nr:cellulase family glycosylhydrolase [Candidatus Dormibacteraeota bacterium]MBO0743579.1 cellulase family glycosylhydrolase [Candidatus Dormibacteraeota bacterium]